MASTFTSNQRHGQEDAQPNWDALFPPDPELMASAEGDTKGLRELKRATRERNDQRENT